MAGSGVAVVAGVVGGAVVGASEVAFTELVVPLEDEVVPGCVVTSVVPLELDVVVASEVFCAEVVILSALHTNTENDNMNFDQISYIQME